MNPFWLSSSIVCNVSDIDLATNLAIILFIQFPTVIGLVSFISSDWFFGKRKSFPKKMMTRLNRLGLPLVEKRPAVNLRKTAIRLQKRTRARPSRKNLRKQQSGSQRQKRKRVPSLIKNRTTRLRRKTHRLLMRQRSEVGGNARANY